MSCKHGGEESKRVSDDGINRLRTNGAAGHSMQVRAKVMGDGVNAVRVTLQRQELLAARVGCVSLVALAPERRLDQAFPKLIIKVATWGKVAAVTD